MTSDLAAWLLKQIAEDERLACASTPGPWKANDEDYPEEILSDDAGVAVIGGSRWGGEGNVFNDADDARHIVRWNPARALAECEAKRRIIAVEPQRYIIRCLAMAYADRPGYQPEWAVNHG